MEVLLVEVSGIDALMVETLPEVLVDLLSPDSLPFSLRMLPLFKLLLESIKQDRQYQSGICKEIIDDFGTIFTTVDLHDNALWNRLTCSTKSTSELKVTQILFTHDLELLHNWFHQLDGALASLDVEVVVVTLLLDSVHGLFVLVLAMCDESRVF